MTRTSCYAALLCAALSLLPSASFAQTPADVPVLPETTAKDELAAYQKSLEEWGSKNAKTTEEFWQKTNEQYYESTKRLLQCELSAAEAEEYNGQFAGILGNYALEESLASGALTGERFRELMTVAAQAGQKYASTRSDDAKKIYLTYVRQAFNVRLRFALNQPESTREDAFVSLIGDAITFALSVPEYGEDACTIVLTIRTYDPELGEEALDALCEAFENSGEPALIKPIRKTSGVRRYARLPGGELYFDALFPDGKGEYTKKFDAKEHLGKVYLVEVWATWCGPCRREIPRLKEVYERYHDAGFEIFGYSIDQDLDALKKFLKDNEIPWQVASQKKSVEAGFQGLYEYYAINGVPEMILVDRDGKVLEVDCRGMKLANALKELFPDVKPLDWDPANDFSGRAQESDAK